MAMLLMVHLCAVIQAHAGDVPELPVGSEIEWSEFPGRQFEEEGNVRKQMLRIITLVLVIAALASPGMANPPTCETYCKGFCAGWCGAQGKTCYLQGADGDYPNCYCYFGCN